MWMWKTLINTEYTFDSHVLIWYKINFKHNLIRKSFKTKINGTQNQIDLYLSLKYLTLRFYLFGRGLK